MTDVVSLTLQTLCLKNETHSACYNFDIYKSVLKIIGSNVAERVGNQIMLYFSVSPN